LAFFGWRLINLAHDGSEREFNFFNRLERGVCTGRSKKTKDGRYEQSFHSVMWTSDSMRLNWRKRCSHLRSLKASVSSVRGWGLLFNASVKNAVVGVRVAPPAEARLRRILKSDALYYNETRTGFGEGCARFSPGSANRWDQFTRHPRRTS